jgi:hypothetical protein
MCSSILGVNVGRSRLQFILFYFNKSRLLFELETFDSDTMKDDQRRWTMRGTPHVVWWESAC